MLQKHKDIYRDKRFIKQDSILVGCVSPAWLVRP